MSSETEDSDTEIYPYSPYTILNDDGNMIPYSPKITLAAEDFPGKEKNQRYTPPDSHRLIDSKSEDLINKEEIIRSPNTVNYVPGTVSSPRRWLMQPVRADSKLKQKKDTTPIEEISEEVSSSEISPENSVKIVLPPKLHELPKGFSSEFLLEDQAETENISKSPSESISKPSSKSEKTSSTPRTPSRTNKTPRTSDLNAKQKRSVKTPKSNPRLKSPAKNSKKTSPKSPPKSEKTPSAPRTPSRTSKTPRTPDLDSNIKQKRSVKTPNSNPRSKRRTESYNHKAEIPLQYKVEIEDISENDVIPRVSSPRNVKVSVNSRERISVFGNSPDNSQNDDNYVVGGTNHDSNITNLPRNYGNDPEANALTGMDVFNSRERSPTRIETPIELRQPLNTDPLHPFDYDETYMSKIIKKLPNYSSYTPNQLEREWIKYDTLLEKLIDSGIETTRPDPATETLERVFVRYHVEMYKIKKERFIDNATTSIRMWMMIIWVVIELVMCLLLKINFSNYFSFQLSMMKRYDDLLYLLGEKKWMESNKTGIGSPMLQLIFMTTASTIIFALIQVLASGLSPESSSYMTNSVLDIFMGNDRNNNRSGMNVLGELIGNITGGNVEGAIRTFANIFTGQD